MIQLSNCIKTIWKIEFLLFLFAPLIVTATECKISSQGVDGIRLGDTLGEVRDKLSSEFELIELRADRSVKTLQAKRGNKLVLTISFTDKDDAFLIDVYADCFTKEHIGPGSKLMNAILVYGKPSVTPSDSGYLVYFQGIAGVAFLIDDQSIPGNLHGIPDDVFTVAQEHKIGQSKTARFSSVQVFRQY